MKNKPVKKNVVKRSVRNVGLEDYIRRQKAFSKVTYGPGQRVKGVAQHIMKELVEVHQAIKDGEDPMPEWVDIAILAIDGAWRSGSSPARIAGQFERKLSINMKRKWPDWRKVGEGKAIEHIKD